MTNEFVLIPLTARGPLTSGWNLDEYFNPYINPGGISDIILSEYSEKSRCTNIIDSYLE